MTDAGTAAPDSAVLPATPATPSCSSKKPQHSSHWSVVLSRSSKKSRESSPKSARTVPASEFLIAALAEGDILKAQGAVLAGVEPNGARDAHGYTALHLAVKRGSQGLVRMLLKHEADPNAVSTDEQWLTPLHLAFMGGNVSIVRSLMEADADAMAMSADGRSPMELRTGKTAAMEAIVEKAQRQALAAAGLSVEDSLLASPLEASSSSSRRGKRPKDVLRGADGALVIQSILDGDIMRAQGMVLAGAELNNAHDAKGNTALHLAALQGKTGLARLLLSKSADANATSSGNHCTPLHVAVLHGHPLVVRLLLEGRAKVNVATLDGETPLSMSVLDGNLEIVRNLVDHKAQPVIPPSVANTSGSTFLSTGLDEDISIISAVTPAASPSGLNIGDLEHALNQSSRDDNSCQGSSFNLGLDRPRRALIPDDVESRPTSPSSPTALSRALQSNNDKEIIAELMRAGAGTHADGDGKTPLLVAIQNGNMRVARFLLESRADPDAGDQASQTPMHFAAKNGASRLIRLLVENRADVNCRDRAGMCPVQYAVDRATEKQLYQLGAHEVRDGPWHTCAKMLTAAPPKQRVASPSTCSGLTSQLGCSSLRVAVGSPSGRSSRSVRGSRPASRATWTGKILACDTGMGAYYGSNGLSINTTQEPGSPMNSMTMTRSASSPGSAWSPPGRYGDSPCTPPMSPTSKRMLASAPSRLMGLGKTALVNASRAQLAWD